jgi:U2 small nuclear ribonucleoprotein A'
MIALFFSFARNPIAMKKDYRLYVIHMLPNLRTLDYNRVTQKVFISLFI